MTNRRKKISEERYKKLVAMGKRAYGAMLNEAPMEWRCGYGIYGCRPIEADGKFYIEYTTGDSCD